MAGHRRLSGRVGPALVRQHPNAPPAELDVPGSRKVGASSRHHVAISRRRHHRPTAQALRTSRMTLPGHQAELRSMFVTSLFQSATFRSLPSHDGVPSNIRHIRPRP